MTEIIAAEFRGLSFRFQSGLNKRDVILNPAQPGEVSRAQYRTAFNRPSRINHEKLIEEKPAFPKPADAATPEL